MYHPSVVAASLDLTRAGTAGPGAAWGEAGDPSCGDAVRIELAVTERVVVRARHRSFACPHATAAASLA
ncbi:MAG TPA: iron-sulfur cluster assembly scaffold protein, partial [Gaiellales bacterium]|nr:iron-sulfur cluster assembly scaffold protein [Gaiellales bacterium]